MAEVKISQLPTSTSPVASTDYVAGLQGGATVKIPLSQMRTGSINPLWYTTPDSATNSAVALNAMFAANSATATFDGGGRTFYVSQEVIPLAGQTLMNFRFELLASAPSGTCMLRIVTECTYINVFADGVSRGSGTILYYGWIVRASTSNVTLLNCRADNLSFNGFTIDDNNGTWTHDNINGFIESSNCGWVPAQLYSLSNSTLTVNARRCGYHAIDMQNCVDNIFNLNTNKAVAPFTVYSGSGSFGGVERGFLLNRVFCYRNVFNITSKDNRTAAFDGISFGEDGQGGKDESYGNIYNLTVENAGGYGVVLESYSTFNGTINSPLGSGVAACYDYGGTLDQAIANLNVRSPGAYGVDIAAAQAFTGTMTTNGTTTATVTALGAGSVLAVGERIGAHPNVPGSGLALPTTYIVSINGGTTTTSTVPATIVMSVAATAGTVSAATTYQGVITVKNCVLNINAVAGATAVINIYNGAYSSYSNNVINIYYDGTAIGPLYNLVGGVDPGGWTVNVWRAGNTNTILGNPWATYVATVTPVTGSYANCTATGNVKLDEGRTATVRFRATMTNVTGGSAGCVLLLPKVDTDAAQFRTFPVYLERGGVRSTILATASSGGGSGFLVLSAALYTPTNGDVLTFNITYETTFLGT